MIREEYDFHAELDRIADRTRLTDAMLASQIMNWGKKRGIRISDEIAVAYRYGFMEGKKSNEERVAKAFAKIYPAKAKESAPDVAAAVSAVYGESDADRLTEQDVITPDGNTEVEEYAESEE